MIAVQDIAWVRYQVTDLDAIEAFLLDFGLLRSVRTERALYMRAHDSAHHVYIAELGASNRPLGFGLRAGAAADLERLAAARDAAVEDNPDAGGGKRVRLTDPAGFVVDVMHGQTELPALPQRAPIAANPAIGRARLGQPVRLKPAPSSIARIGHVALLVPDFAKAYAFYTEVLGFKASDTYYAGAPENTVAAFMRCGRGDVFTDHHTLALVTAQDGVARFDHSAFEVVDLDDLAQGHAHLKAKGHQHSWGVGRHIQGSQLFDYWRDPFGNKVEHWTDGDLVNDATPVGRAHVSGDELAQWAPPLTPEFFV